MDPEVQAAISGALNGECQDLRSFSSSALITGALLADAFSEVEKLDARVCVVLFHPKNFSLVVSEAAKERQVWVIGNDDRALFRVRIDLQD